ncbi:hypothetical protein D3C72_2077160 [compost metagenome]
MRRVIEALRTRIGHAVVAAPLDIDDQRILTRRCRMKALVRRRKAFRHRQRQNPRKDIEVRVRARHVLAL